jgi:hypothetical protein
MNSEYNGFMKYWDSIGGSLCKSILPGSKYLDSNFSNIARILGTLSGMS